jgi:hypothetical protein
MQDGEVFLLKDGELYSNKHAESPVSLSDLEAGSRLLIDDKYFFYVGLGKLSIGKSKSHPIVANYLQSLFPMDILSGFLVFEYKGEYIALIYKENFAALLENYRDVFKKAKKISTILCELSTLYSSFQFTDGQTCYEKKMEGLDIIIPENAQNVLSQNDFWLEASELKNDLSLPNIERGKAKTKGYKTIGVLTTIIYIFFLGGLLLALHGLKLTEAALSEKLSALYTEVGLANVQDPFKELENMTKSQSAAPFRSLDMLSIIGEAISKEITVDSLTVSERVVRIEGFANDFAGVESLKTDMFNRLKKEVTLDETRQLGDRVKFTMRYEP